MVSRAAFYRNYQDKYDLVEQIFEEAMNALLKAVGDLGQEHPSEIWVTFFEHIAQYERLYRALLGSKGSPWFARKMRASLAGLIKERARLPHGPDARAHPDHTFSDEFVPDIVSAMFVEAIIWWLEQGRPYTPREIATRSALLAAALFKEASTWQ
jgi:AcrR family transcriptional regulator